ncbi:hypothetical protein GCM10010218_65390 [Streptomyces mashuensis]|uniref:Uncharacterized protein n=1 Tax=Streptomyces mashuensis TaxID=33904 RepID=A0A919BA63_9ACTN|nr:hypothetical protein GCM10010218_65390 [Streptomyces mashuensis]
MRQSGPRRAGPASEEAERAAEDEAEEAGEAEEAEGAEEGEVVPELMTLYPAEEVLLEQVNKSSFHRVASLIC